MDGPGLPGSLIIYQGHLVALKEHLWLGQPDWGTGRVLPCAKDVVCLSSRFLREAISLLEVCCLFFPEDLSKWMGCMALEAVMGRGCISVTSKM